MKINLIKINGILRPSYSGDFEKIRKIPEGKEILVTYNPKRNPEFHRKAFALLNLGFDNQDKFDNFEVYRKVMTIKAGYFTSVESKKGVQFLPDSLSYDSMNAEDFENWFNKILDLIEKDLGTKIGDELSGYY